MRVEANRVPVRLFCNHLHKCFAISLGEKSPLGAEQPQNEHWRNVQNSNVEWVSEPNEQVKDVKLEVFLFV